MSAGSTDTQQSLQEELQDLKTNLLKLIESEQTYDFEDLAKLRMRLKDVLELYSIEIIYDKSQDWVNVDTTLANMITLKSENDWFKISSRY